MSYTLKGRLESRLAALLPPLLAAVVLATALRSWWPVELAGAMVAALLALDLAYHPLLSRMLWRVSRPVLAAWRRLRGVPA